MIGGAVGARLGNAPYKIAISLIRGAEVVAKTQYLYGLTFWLSGSRSTIAINERPLNCPLQAGC
ncbi:MAG: hypothetical protein EHM73_03910 [Chroococcales cyanobacterium metabat2.561]|uniref:Uncharacterized protein n=1 Tax=Microcystis aeruginosa Ma_SC_T_19800800_S464 TaxID=2486257 RepID=A0A552DPM0_MICAE|nr:MAG: hypothetical protein EHM73_03910 [Chroococcales cyanobacterium metabat2.561]TRT85583.1 MAG: hypothetical protein EWV82_06890 [Microcystis aeruginosa Ma_AC_P_19900807_S299]TRU24172.1 MAG: hypothetical protein EWV81_14795 [Microcystis aeruginosa Ma_SC_T_19800800_S464]